MRIRFLVKKLSAAILATALMASMVVTDVYAVEDDATETVTVAEDNQEETTAEEVTEEVTETNLQGEAIDEDELLQAGTLTVNFINSMSSTPIPSRTVTVGQSYGDNDNPLPYPTAGEFFFKGWYTQPDDDVSNPGVRITQDTLVDDTAPYVQAGVVTLYSHWARKTDKSKVVGTSLTLSGKIALNFYITIPEKISNDENSKLTIKDATDSFRPVETFVIKDHLYGIEDGSDVYKFTYALSAKNMADNLEVRIYDGDGNLQPFTNAYLFDLNDNAFRYSVNKYLEGVAASDSEEASFLKLKALAASLRTYGDLARVYFNVNVPATIPSVEQFTKEDVAHDKVVSGTMPEGIRYKGSSLVLKTDTSVRHYFELEEGRTISEYGFTIDGNAVSSSDIIANENLYYIEISNIPGQFLGTSHVLGVTGADYQDYQIQYSPLSYVYSSLDKSNNDKLKNLCRAVYAYYTAAVAYFGDPGQGGYVAPTADMINNRFDETNLIVTNGEGAVLKNWNYVLIDGVQQRYYSDPATGYVVTGFNYIDGKLYYFGQTVSDVGRMKRGFVKAAGPSERIYGNDFYDATAGASNIYFAGADGVLHGPGWENITASEKPATGNDHLNEQVWSYYFAPNYPASSIKADSFVNGVRTKGNFAIGTVASEVTCGDVFITNDGNVVTLNDLGISTADIASDDLSKYTLAAAGQGLGIDNYYRFNESTGARRRAVLYFYGNYYGNGNNGSMWNAAETNLWSYLDKNQVNSVAGMRRWINSDRTLSDNTVDFIAINGEENKRDFEDFGKFPMAASSFVGDAYDEKTQAFKYRMTNPSKYGDRQDIASGFGFNGSTLKYEFTKIPDGNVDVYDTMCYSYSEYLKYLEKFGPKNIALMGSSSGAGICVSIQMIANLNGDAQPAKTVLLCPWLDVSTSVRNPVENSNSNTNVATLRYWGARYTRDARYAGDEGFVRNGQYTGDISTRSDYFGHEGPGVFYWMASPAMGCKEISATGSYAGLNNIYMYSGNEDPCKLSAFELYDKVKAFNPSATIVNREYVGATACGHGFMFNPNNSLAAEALRDAQSKIMIE